MSAADGQNRLGRHRSQSLYSPAHGAQPGWTPPSPDVAKGETVLSSATRPEHPHPLPRIASGANLPPRTQYRRDRKRTARQKLAFRVGPAAVVATLLVGTSGLAGTNSVAAGTTPLTAQAVSMAQFSGTASNVLETHVARNVAPSLSKNLNVALAETSDVAASVPDQAAEALSEVTELSDNTGAAVTESVPPVEVVEPEAPSREDAQKSASRNGTRSAESSPSTTSAGYAAPITGATITSRYGMRWGRMHNGTDFAAPTGHPLNAVGSGTITNGYSANGRGIYVDLMLDDGTLISYGHMSSSLVSDGQRVGAGDVIGLVGNTGRSFGAHVHLEVSLPGGTRVNPQPWLAQQGLL